MPHTTLVLLGERIGHAHLAEGQAQVVDGRQVAGGTGVPASCPDDRRRTGEAGDAHVGREDRTLAGPVERGREAGQPVGRAIAVRHDVTLDDAGDDDGVARPLEVGGVRVEQVRAGEGVERCLARVGHSSGPGRHEGGGEHVVERGRVGRGSGRQPQRAAKLGGQGALGRRRLVVVGDPGVLDRRARHDARAGCAERVGDGLHLVGIGAREHHESHRATSEGATDQPRPGLGGELVAGGSGPACCVELDAQCRPVLAELGDLLGERVPDRALERTRTEHDPHGESHEDRDDRDEVVAEVDHVKIPPRADQRSSRRAPRTWSRTLPPGVAQSAAVRANNPTRTMTTSQLPEMRER